MECGAAPLRRLRPYYRLPPYWAGELPPNDTGYEATHLRYNYTPTYPANTQASRGPPTPTPAHMGNAMETSIHTSPGSWLGSGLGD